MKKSILTIVLVLTVFACSDKTTSTATPSPNISSAEQTSTNLPEQVSETKTLPALSTKNVADIKSDFRHLMSLIKKYEPQMDKTVNDVKTGKDSFRQYESALRSKKLIEGLNRDLSNFTPKSKEIDELRLQTIGVYQASIPTQDLSAQIYLLISKKETTKRSDKDSAYRKDQTYAQKTDKIEKLKKFNKDIEKIKKDTDEMKKLVDELASPTLHAANLGLKLAEKTELLMQEYQLTVPQ